MWCVGLYFPAQIGKRDPIILAFSVLDTGYIWLQTDKVDLLWHYPIELTALYIVYKQ